ncbi:MAG TPA: hypothetical protein VI643_06900 [Planctomycetota bacterium]|nr:hypothetical protein [Planctomycetota bacterium]
MTGEDAWTDCEFAAHVTVVEGGSAQPHYRITEGHRCGYTLDLLSKDQLVRLARSDNRQGGPGLVPVMNAPLKTEYGREYELRVVVKGKTVTGYVDGQPIGAMTDDWNASSRVGLGLSECKAKFRAPPDQASAIKAVGSRLNDHPSMLGVNR